VPASRLAIDLSGGTIRVLDGVPGGPMRSAEIGVAEQAMDGGRIRDPAAVGAAVRQLLARAEINTGRAMVAASDAIASFRVMSFAAGTSDAEVEAEVRAQLPAHDRLSIRRREVLDAVPGRTIYATAWDRDSVRAITESVHHAGLDTAVVDLKSLCLARAVTAPSCVILDLSSQPVEAILIDAHVPRAWHSFKAGSDGDLAATITAGLKPVFAFYRTRAEAFPADAPILVRSEQMLPAPVVHRLRQLTGRPVEPVPQPARVDPTLRYGAFLTCIGLVMRRAS